MMIRSYARHELQGVENWPSFRIAPGRMRYNAPMRIAMILGVLLLAYDLGLAEEAATKPEAHPTVLVMPFEALSADSEQDAAAVTKAMDRSLAIDLSRLR